MRLIENSTGFIIVNDKDDVIGKIEINPLISKLEKEKTSKEIKIKIEGSE